MSDKNSKGNNQPPPWAKPRPASPVSDALLSYGLGAGKPMAARVQRSEPQLFAEAQQCTDAGDLDRAEALLNDLLARHPGHPLTLHELGRVANRRGDAERAVELIGQAIAAAPQTAPFHVNLGNALQRLGRTDESIDAFRRATELQPDFPEAHFNLGLALANAGRQGPAAASFRRAAEIRPDYVRAHSALAGALAGAGDEAGAVEALHRVREIDPQNVAAASALAPLRPVEAGDPVFDLLERASAEPDTPAEDRRAAFFALARMYDDVGEYDRAFAAAANGNALLAQAGAAAPYDAEGFRAFVDRTVALLDAGFFAARSGWGAKGDLPVLVVGVPSAGGDRVAALLTAHPAAASGGEADWLGAVQRRVEADAGMPWPDCAEALDADAAKARGTDYLAHMRPAGVGGVRRVVDANPLNFQTLGLAALLLPGARVVHCIRDARETCLAGFMSDLAGRYSFGGDFGRLIAFTREYERLMDHWRAALPLEMMEVFHEDLLRGPAGEGAALLDFLGLDAAEASLPQTARGDFDWRNYAQHLGPVLDAFGRD